MSLTMVRGSLGVTSGSITRLTGAVVLVHRQMLAVLGMKNEEEKEKKRRFLNDLGHESKDWKQGDNSLVHTGQDDFFFFFFFFFFFPP